MDTLQEKKEEDLTVADADFQIVGRQEVARPKRCRKRKWWKDRPLLSEVLLALVVIGCLGCRFLMTKDPAYMDLMHCNEAPGWEFLFGTDTMGRDIFSMIWYGGRISLFIGVFATLISTMVAIVFGAVSGCAPDKVDAALMRFTEIFLSIPELLLVILLQAVLGKANVVSISVVIGLTGWASIAKIVRTEVKQIRNSEYVIAARCMGGSFWYILWQHLTPNFASSIMFMVVMNIRSAIIAESTLSFMGIGLPLEQISWGSMLSNADKALMTQSWWIILIPGVFLVVTLMCMTNIGNDMRKRVNRRERNL